MPEVSRVLDLQDVGQVDQLDRGLSPRDHVVDGQLDRFGLLPGAASLIKNDVVAEAGEPPAEAGVPVVQGGHRIGLFPGGDTGDVEQPAHFAETLFGRIEQAQGRLVVEVFQDVVGLDDEPRRLVHRGGQFRASAGDFGPRGGDHLGRGRRQLEAAGLVAGRQAMDGHSDVGVHRLWPVGRVAEYVGTQVLGRSVGVQGVGLLEQLPGVVRQILLRRVVHPLPLGGGVQVQRTELGVPARQVVVQGSR
ncbi:hypothetical protein GCM10023321_81120 [Pseudonocardia eucalypti]|uniref:Uncharacterized protein n=1 Tax=Pseudonocardia eucalypti TaxID=648755 RepID=A0ABP9RD38_9PSEU